MNKKVLITLTYYAPHISGLTNAAKNLAELLANNNYAVTVLTTQHSKSLPLFSTEQHVSVIRMPYFFKVSKGFFYANFVKSVFNYVRKNDIVLINLPQAEGIVIALVAKFFRRRLLCFYHCNVVLEGGIFARIVEYSIRLGNTLCFMLADTIIVTSKDFAEHDSSVRKYKKKWVVFPPIITTPFAMSANRVAIPQIERIKKYHIGFLGRIAREKGIANLIGAISVLRKTLGDSFQIVLAGPANAVGEEKYTQEMFSLIKRYPAYISYIGVLTDEQIGSFYSSIDVLVVPSINATEAFGMVQLEAMSAGVPVVASNLPGIRVPIRQTGMGELCEPEDSQSIAEAITRVVQHPQRYKKSKMELQKYFSPQSILAEFTSIVSEKS